MIFSLRITILLITFIFAFSFMAAAVPGGRSTFYDLVVNGIRRSYTVYCPDTMGGKNLPLMVVLHGGLGNAFEIEKRTGMNRVADTGPFVVVYPNGVAGRIGRKNRRTWNAGDCCGMAAKRDVDDVRFIEIVIERVKQSYSIDNRRVYVAGMSNGGMMAYRLASEMPDKVAAVVAVSAALDVDNFDAAKNTAVLHIHGTDDKFVPMAGGVGQKSISKLAHRSLADTVKLIMHARRCTTKEVKMVGKRVQSSVYRCSRGAPVEVVLIQGGAHKWPGGHARRAGSEPKGNFSASRYAWEFARKYSLTNK